MLELAKAQGGYKLNCFDTFLPEKYKKHGFVEVGRDKWNEAYKPADWDKEAMKKWNNGEPDVVYMELKEQPKTKPVESAEDILAKIDNGEFKINSYKDIDNVVDGLAKTDIDVTGSDWTALVHDASKATPEQQRLLDLIDTDSLRAAFSNLEQESAQQLTRKQLIAAKIMSILNDKIFSTDDSKLLLKYREQLEYFNQYIKGIASTAGNILQTQRFIKRTIDVFSQSRLHYCIFRS